MPSDPSFDVRDVMSNPFCAGLMASGLGGERSGNPHPVDSLDWQEWLRGFAAWEDAPKVTLEIPDGSP